MPRKRTAEPETIAGLQADGDARCTVKPAARLLERQCHQLLFALVACTAAKRGLPI
jgi:hypothetical protein